jgi:glycine oxidase
MRAGVVGAGICGKLMALSLLQQGWEVTMFDQSVTATDNCSNAAAGLLTPLSELDKSDLLIFQLGRDALNTHWPSILKQLPEPVDFRASGSLILSHPQDQAELTHFIHRISHRLGREDYFKTLQQAELRQSEPELSHFHKAYYFSEEGCLNAQHFLKLAEDYLQQQGVKWRMGCHVEAVQPYKIILKTGVQQFDQVFDCRGLGARSHFSDLRGVRGELLWVHAPEVNIQHPIRFLHPRYSVYIAPRADHTYLVGASEIDAEDFTPISVRSSLELLTAAYYLHPGFAEARIKKSVVHCRPTLANHLPLVKYTEGLIAVNGLSRHGYLIAPTLTHDVLLYLTEGAAAVCYPQIWERGFL